jgi:hypothetical protein
MKARSIVSFAAAASVLALSSVALAGGTLSVDAPFKANDQAIGVKYDVKVPLATAGSGGVATGRAIASPICVLKAPSASSSQFFKAALTGARLKTVSFSGPGGLTIKLDNAMVSGVSLDEKDVEEICFSPQKMTLSVGGASFTWDFSTARAA